MYRPFIALLFCGGALFAQQRIPSNSNNVFSNNLDFFAIQKVDQVVSNGLLGDLKGSPYLFEEWPVGEIISHSDKAPKLRLPFNYNVVRDQFEVRAGDSQYVLDPTAIQSIRSGERTFMPGFIERRRYYEMIAVGERAEVRRVFTFQVMEVPTKTLGQFEQQLRIDGKEYLVLPDGTVQKMPRSKRKLLKVLEAAPGARDAFRDHDLDEPADLQELLSAP